VCFASKTGKKKERFHTSSFVHGRAMQSSIMSYGYIVSLFQGNRRETRLLGILSFVHSTVWKVLFGKVSGDFKFN